MTNEPDRNDQPEPLDEPGASRLPAALPPEPPPAPEGPRRLVRSRRERMIAGVAGGLAEYFDVDPAIVRLAFVLLTLLTGGLGIPAYIVAWIVMPEARPGEERAGGVREERGGGSASGAVVLGIILIALGVVALLLTLDLDIPALRWDVILSAALILVGLAIVVESRRGLNGGLMALALVLTGALALSTTVIGVDFDSGFGQRTVQPASVEELDDFGHAFGSMTVDLRSIEFPEGTTRVEASVAFGEIRVLLPEDIAYRVEASSFLGSTELPERESGGVATNVDYESPGYDEAQRRVFIELNSAFGSAKVLQ